MEKLNNRMKNKNKRRRTQFGHEKTLESNKININKTLTKQLIIIIKGL